MSSGVAGGPHHIISLEPRLFARGLLQLSSGLLMAPHVLAVGGTLYSLRFVAVYVSCCYCLFMLLYYEHGLEALFPEDYVQAEVRSLGVSSIRPQKLQ